MKIRLFITTTLVKFTNICHFKPHSTMFPSYPDIPDKPSMIQEMINFNSYNIILLEISGVPPLDLRSYQKTSLLKKPVSRR